MKKLIVLFIIILLPHTTFAQDKMLCEINKQIEGNPQEMTKQELNSKLVNEWGGKELRFLELKNGTLIPMKVKKSNKLLKAQDTEWWVYVAVAGGIILIIVLIWSLMYLKAWNDAWDETWNQVFTN